MEKLLLSIPEFCEVTGVGTSTAKKLLMAGTVLSIKVGDRRLVPADAAREFVNRLVEETRSARAGASVRPESVAA